MVLGVTVFVFIDVSLYRYLTGEPSRDHFLRVLLGILVWALPKGALLRYLGATRPYRRALAANGASELCSLGFPVSPFGMPWGALGASFVISTLLEGIVLFVMGSSRAVVCLGWSLYINFFAHVLLAGWFLWPVSKLAGGFVILFSFLIFILPIFVVDRDV
jgi:hypothetical protein